MPDNTYERSQMAGLIIGPLLAVGMLMVPGPVGLSADGWIVAAVSLWMGTWWMTEAVPLAATALLPLVLFPPLGQADLPLPRWLYDGPGDG